MSELESLLADIRAKNELNERLKQRQLQHDNLLSLKQHKIKSYYRTTKLLNKWGLNESKPLININTPNDVINLLRDNFNGSHLVSDNFLKSCCIAIEKPFIESKQKIKGKEIMNTKEINTQLKFLKGRLRLMLKLSYRERYFNNERIVKFIDRDLPLRFIIDEVIYYFNQVINNGYEFKKIKIYNSVSGNLSSNSYQILYSQLMTISNKKPSSKTKQVNRKDNTRRIKIYNRLPILSFSSKGELIGITRYKKKELPYYLQD